MANMRTYAVVAAGRRRRGGGGAGSCVDGGGGGAWVRADRGQLLVGATAGGGQRRCGAERPVVDLARRGPDPPDQQWRWRRVSRGGLTRPALGGLLPGARQLQSRDRPLHREY